MEGMGKVAIIVGGGDTGGNVVTAGGEIGEGVGSIGVGRGGRCG